MQQDTPVSGPAGDPGAVRGDPAARTLALPGGMVIACQSRLEAEQLHADIFDKQIYLRNGITLHDGACVFDVGGNIGLFTLFIHRQCRRPLTFTFEPAPPLFRILSYNAGRYCPEAKLFPCGLAARRGRAALTFYPYSSGMSSFHANLDEEKDVLRTIMANQRRAGMSEMDELMADLDELLEARLSGETIECDLLPLSSVIVDQRVATIDLLKIDVQKCELEVLQGIEAGHWPRVRQIVMEVHDLDGRLAQVVELLRGRGFEVVAEQDPLLAGSVLWNLFALRAPA
jgi:FkbM family methyltransferase